MSRHHGLSMRFFSPRKKTPHQRKFNRTSGNRMTAICVRGACKDYGNGSQKETVLQELDLTVDKGTIYALMGASGCGKTTLLTCIVGRRRLDSGDIWVLGGKPGSRESGVPGPLLGYMPQELSLLREFTIRDALQHFAWIYEMAANKFEERYQFLHDLLELPPGNLWLSDISGGEQRRVSLAVALIHDPELLILDEPTVGLDPVLREIIWEHMREIAAQGKTIIITTHYIEESRQAHRIGIMRGGKLMAEESPEELLQQYNSNTIEEVFLKLSECQEQSKHRISQLNERPKPMRSNTNGRFQSHGREEIPLEELGNVLYPKDVTESINRQKHPDKLGTKIGNACSNLFFQKRGHAKALLSKNFFQIIKHPASILITILFPVLTVTFYILMGSPRGMKLGIINEELGPGGSCKSMAEKLGSAFGGTPNRGPDGIPYCSLRGLSCKFLDSLNESLAQKVFFDDLESGMRAARAGRLIGVLHFSQNYSHELQERIQFGAGASNQTFEKSVLSVWLDASKGPTAVVVELKLKQTHEVYLKSILRECQIPEKVSTNPLHFNKPIFGNQEIDWAQTTMPGVLVTIIFFASLSVTTMLTVAERLDGNWDRTFCAGVTSREILLAHVIVKTGAILLQIAEVFILAFYIFQYPCHGSHLHIVILLFLQAFAGMSAGFLISVSCSTIITSTCISMGSYYTFTLFSRVLWPIEGMPTFLRIFSMGMPTTMAITSLRNIMEKGWGMFHNHVYQGYLISIVWIFIFLAPSFLIIKLRK